MLAAAVKNTITESAKPRPMESVLRAFVWRSPRITSAPWFHWKGMRKERQMAFGKFRICAQTIRKFSTNKVHRSLSVAWANPEAECQRGGQSGHDCEQMKGVQIADHSCFPSHLFACKLLKSPACYLAKLRNPRC